jgi:hypothetical protein
VFTGEVSFVANVDSCRRLELEVTTTDGAPDAGVVDAAP